MFLQPEGRVSLELSELQSFLIHLIRPINLFLNSEDVFWFKNHSFLVITEAFKTTLIQMLILHGHISYFVSLDQRIDNNW